MRRIVKSHYKKFFKYTMVGGVNAIIDLGAFAFILHALGAHAVIAHMCSFLLVFTNSFIINTLWTFKSTKTAISYHNYMRFIAMGICALGASTVVFYLSQGIVGAYGAKMLAMLTSFVMSYILSWRFVFRPSDKN